MLFGLISSLVLVLLSPNVWNPPTWNGHFHRKFFFTMSNPTIFTVPLGFIGAYLGSTVLSKEKEDKNKFAEVLFQIKHWVWHKLSKRSLSKGRTI